MLSHSRPTSAKLFIVKHYFCSSFIHWSITQLDLLNTKVFAALHGCKDYICFLFSPRVFWFFTSSNATSWCIGYLFLALLYPNSQLANQKPTLLSWYPTISSHWPDSATATLNFGLNLGTVNARLVSPWVFWRDVVEPKYKPFWLDQTHLICHRSVPKRYD